MLNKLYQNYLKLILNPSPSKTWKSIRFVLHWLTLFPKVIAIGSLGLFQIVLKLLTSRARTTPEIPPLEKKRAYFQKIMRELPVLKTEELELYCTRIPYGKIPDTHNQNTDHQALRHGTYSFLMNKLDLKNEKIDAAMKMHLQGKWLCRGYKINPYEDQIAFNAHTTSGDMLCGTNLAMMSNPDNMLKDKFEELIHSILSSDYSLLEYGGPGVEDDTYAIYKELFEKVGEKSELLQMKSSRGMWQPGIETVGAQALTVLSALRVSDKICKDPDAHAAYKKLLYKYGYGLLSLFPTAYIDSKRGYFNDHNCLMALNVLSKLADNKLGKLFWKTSMIYVWLLSRHWYNGYFTGLVNDAHPGTIGDKYIEKCQAYLYEQEPNTWTVETTTQEIDQNIPVNYNNIPGDEFSPEIAQNLSTTLNAEDKIRTGLGFMAAAVMLEKDPKCLLG